MTYHRASTNDKHYIKLNGYCITSCNRQPLSDFFSHLLQAALAPNSFVFDGAARYSGKRGAREWLEYHRKNLGLQSMHGTYELYQHGVRVAQFDYPRPLPEVDWDQIPEWMGDKVKWTPVSRTPYCDHSSGRHYALPEEVCKSLPQSVDVHTAVVYRPS